MLRNFHSLREPEIARCVKRERVNGMGKYNPRRPKVDQTKVLEWKGLLKVLTVLEENTVPKSMKIFDFSTPGVNFKKVSTFVSFLKISRVVPANRVQRLVDIANVVDQKSQIEALGEIEVDDLIVLWWFGLL